MTQPTARMDLTARRIRKILRLPISRRFTYRYYHPDDPSVTFHAELWDTKSAGSIECKKHQPVDPKDYKTVKTAMREMNQVWLSSQP